MSHPCRICGAPAMGPYSANSYCSKHSSVRIAALDKVEAAREYMAAGFTLKQTAEQLGMLASDLDVALWTWLGQKSAPRRYKPEFVA
ncbi:hypothetical protein J2X45_003917 [Caulobacter sp. BE264]|uniref:hypothetical protein n=1 Tax=Caulobacter sp. BE264 TaxID=2817724 RepID=UPI002854B7CB|nr:hypothetical protein [Caulobacter sp. BE264]MDR7232807.1 hypothetical protein [Caulobacter sp. BE264]